MLSLGLVLDLVTKVIILALEFRILDGLGLGFGKGYDWIRVRVGLELVWS